MTDQTPLDESLDPILAALCEGTTFDPRPLVPRPHLMWDITGKGKSGKSDAAVRTLASLIAYMGWDTGDEGVVDKWQFGEDGTQRIIRCMERHAPLFETSGQIDKGDQSDRGIKPVAAFDIKAYYRQVLHRFRNNFLTMINRGVRSLVVDTMTEVDEVARMAEHGKITQIKQQHYFPINRLMIELYNAAANSNTNLITLGQGTDEFEERVAPGKTDPEWRKTGRIARQRYHDKVDFLVQAFFVARFIDPVRNTTQGMMPMRDNQAVLVPPGGVLAPGRFELELIRSRTQPDLVGRVWTNDEINIPLICMELYPDVDPEVWEDPHPVKAR